MRFIITFILIFIWACACAPKKKYRKQYSRPDYAERYDNKYSKKSVRTIKKKPRTVESLSPVINNPTLLPTILNKKDQTLMVLVDQGKYLVGMKKMAAQKILNSNEKDSQLLAISAFYIDRTETTVANFKKFQPRYNETPFTDGKSCPQCPAMGISWYQAQKYCQWAGKRLPTEGEWEAAARGNSAFVWPWGNDNRPEHANTFGNDDGFLFVAPVGSFSKGVSPFGVMDMAGNVWEWITGEKNDLKIAKGGGWTSYMSQSKISFRNAVDPKLKNPTFGFRCAKNGFR